MGAVTRATPQCCKDERSFHVPEGHADAAFDVGKIGFGRQSRFTAHDMGQNRIHEAVDIGCQNGVRCTTNGSRQNKTA